MPENPRIGINDNLGALGTVNLTQASIASHAAIVATAPGGSSIIDWLSNDTSDQGNLLVQIVTQGSAPSGFATAMIPSVDPLATAPNPAYPATSRLLTLTPANLGPIFTSGPGLTVGDWKFPLFVDDGTSRNHYAAGLDKSLLIHAASAPAEPTFGISYDGLGNTFNAAPTATQADLIRVPGDKFIANRTVANCQS